jgi:hypothetical protein
MLVGRNAIQSPVLFCCVECEKADAGSDGYGWIWRCSAIRPDTNLILPTGSGSTMWR